MQILEEFLTIISLEFHITVPIDTFSQNRCSIELSIYVFNNDFPSAYVLQHLQNSLNLF
jgi:hypothetical protein